MDTEQNTSRNFSALGGEQINATGSLESDNSTIRQRVASEDAILTSLRFGQKNQNDVPCAGQLVSPVNPHASVPDPEGLDALRKQSMFVEDDDDEYIDLSEISDEIFRSVDAFSTDEEDYLDFENDAGDYY